MMWMLFALLAAAPQPGEIKTFKDWTVGCDNVRSCHATSLLPPDGDWDQPVTMSIKRAGAADAQPVIAISMEGRPSRISIGGKPLNWRLAESNSELVVDRRDSQAALTALRAGDALVLHKAGGASDRISLAGLAAALLYMDEQQQRLGTVTALQRPGSKPASAVPPVPALPQLRSASRNIPLATPLSEAEINRLRTKYECVAENKDWPGYGSEQYALDEKRGLLLLGCGAGAYNFTSIPFVFTREAKGRQIALAAFDLKPRWTDGDAAPSLVNAEWDPKAGTLTSFAKGRGIGDCGIGSDYAWDGERFRLINQIEMDECRGSLDYITTWRAEVRR
jgi:hypothetical protein